MARKKKNIAGEAAEPPMSSMIDVVFLLLIYFVVTQKEIIPEAHLAVNLPGPPPKTQPPPPKEPPVVIDIRVLSNEYQFMNVPIRLSSLRERLIQFGMKDANYTVMIKTDVYATNQRLVNILDACKRAGLEQLNIVTLY
jgi:biopolymer transport protein ExbD